MTPKERVIGMGENTQVIKFKTKSQSNSKELLDLLKTIKSAKVVQRPNGMTYVYIKKRSALPCYKGRVGRQLKESFSHQESVPVKESTLRHYNAIVVKDVVR